MERGGPPTKAPSPEATCAYVSVSLDGFSNNSDFFFFSFLKQLFVASDGHFSIARWVSFTFFFWLVVSVTKSNFCVLSPFISLLMESIGRNKEKRKDS